MPRARGAAVLLADEIPHRPNDLHSLTRVNLPSTATMSRNQPHSRRPPCGICPVVSSSGGEGEGEVAAVRVGNASRVVQGG